MYVCCLLFHPDVFIALLSTTAFTSEEMTRFPVSRGAWPPAPPRVPGPRQIPHPTGRFSISSLRGLLLEDLCMNHRLTTFSLFINTDFLFSLYDHFLGFRNHLVHEDSCRKSILLSDCYIWQSICNKKEEKNIWFLPPISHYHKLFMDVSQIKALLCSSTAIMHSLFCH